MSTRHPFLDGRRIAALAPLAAGTYALAFAFWYGSVEGSRCGVGLVEILAVGFALISTWLLSPTMATWEATGTRKVRRLASLASLTTIATAAATPIAIYLAVTRLPSSMVPRADQYDFGDVGLAVWLPAVTNIFVLAGVAAITVALAGRLAGTVATLAAYAALFWVGANTNAPGPYTAFCSTDTGAPAWAAASVVLVMAAAILITTGGATVLSRRLDPRHTG